MPKPARTYSQLSLQVAIDQGFPGTYIVPKSTGNSYYLNGESTEGDIHFTVEQAGWNAEGKFHISRDVGGANYSVYYIGDVYSPPPKCDAIGEKVKAGELWMKENKTKCDEAATAFWGKMGM